MYTIGCMYVRMYACMHACMHAWMYVGMYVCTYMYIYKLMHRESSGITFNEDMEKLAQLVAVLLCAAIELLAWSSSCKSETRHPEL